MTAYGFDSALSPSRTQITARPRVLSLAIAAVLAAPALQAATYTVRNTNDSGPGSLRQAISEANANPGVDDIRFNGVTGTVLLTSGQLSITDALTINGPGAESLAIDGNARSRVFDISNAAVTLNALTIQNGSASGAGGGIQAGSNSLLTLANSVISGNSASTTGGGIYAASTLSLNNSAVVGNSAEKYGGGGISASLVSLNKSSVTDNFAGGEGDGGGISASEVSLTQSKVSGNSAGRDGGGIHASTATLTNSIVSENDASRSGGGISAGFDASLSLSDSIVSGNSAGSTGGGIHAKYATLTGSTISGNRAGGAGGGIYAGSTLTVIDSMISGNSTSASGGGITAQGQASLANSAIVDNYAASNGGGVDAYSAALTNSTVSGNWAGGKGGGLSNTEGPALTLSNSTVSGNSAGSTGGGVYAKSNLSLINSTVSSNSSSSAGGGIYAKYGARLTNGVITNNLGGDCYDYIDAVVANNTLIQDGSCGITAGNNGNLTGDPKLAPLRDNGCAKRAGAPSTSACVQTHALQAGSPAIGAGDHGACIAAPVDGKDERAFLRNDGACDIGAYEHNAGVNGVCGSANGETLTSAPSGAALCAAGTASAVTGSGPWSWSCDGINDGSDAQCAAAVQSSCLNCLPSRGGWRAILQRRP